MASLRKDDASFGRKTLTFLYYTLGLHPGITPLGHDFRMAQNHTVLSGHVPKWGQYAPPVEVLLAPFGWRGSSTGWAPVLVERRALGSEASGGTLRDYGSTGLLKIDTFCNQLKHVAFSTPK